MAAPEEPNAQEAPLADEIATLLIGADAGDAVAEAEMADRYATDHRLRPGSTVQRFSPDGGEVVVDWIGSWSPEGVQA
jgi:hypothetical protein